MTKRLYKFHVDTASLFLGSDKLINKQNLQKFYGGNQFHLKSDEIIIKKHHYAYIDFNNNCMATGISCSQPDKPYSTEESECFPFLSQQEIEKKLNLNFGDDIAITGVKFLLFGLVIFTLI